MFIFYNKYMENNGIFDVLDESYPALKIGVCAPAAMDRLTGKPWKRARIIMFKIMAGFALSARKIDLHT